jgi:hypothetical protein
VAHDKERVQLRDQIRRLQAKAASDDRHRAEEGLAVAERGGGDVSGTGASRALQTAKLEIADLRLVAGEAMDRADATEGETRAAEERLARARAEYRALLKQGIGERLAARPAPPDGARYAAEIDLLDSAIAELRGALLRDVQGGEEEAQAQLGRLKERYDSLRQTYAGLAGGVLRSVGGIAGGAGGVASGGAASSKPGMGDAMDAESERVVNDATELRRRVAALTKEKQELGVTMEEAAAVYTRTVAQLRASEQRAEQKPAPARQAAGGKEEEEARRDAEVQRAVKRLQLENGELHKQLDRRKASEARVAELTAEVERLQLERGDHNKDYHELRSERTAQVQVRELASSMASLEAERSKLIRRATSAEEQLNALQGAMSANILTYQKEIIRLRKALQQAGSRQLQQ